MAIERDEKMEVYTYRGFAWDFPGEFPPSSSVYMYRNLLVALLLLFLLFLLSFLFSQRGGVSGADIRGYTVVLLLLIHPRIVLMLHCYLQVATAPSHSSSFHRTASHTDDFILSRIVSFSVTKWLHLELRSAPQVSIFC
jgi:hypothetical protein